MRNKTQMVTAAMLAALAIAPPGAPGAKGINLTPPTAQQTGRLGGGFTLMDILGIPSRAGGRLGGKITSSLNGRPNSGVKRDIRAAQKLRNVRASSAKHGRPGRIRRRLENKARRAV
jgi:hypothetical protein